jgi:acyl-CoA thioester hydrolase
MTAYFDYFHTVTDDEIDAQQHVHNLRYLQWTLWAARDHSAQVGWNAAQQLAAGVGWVVRSHEIQYRAAALAGDEVVVRTWISEMNRFASRRGFTISRAADRKLLARGETRWVLVDLNARRAISVPDEAVEMLLVLPKPPPLPWESADE